MSWDALNGIRQGEKDAKASERAKRRGAKLAGGGRSGKSKTRFTRKEGRASLNRGGRGISINWQKKVKGGKGFKGAVDYALNPTKSPELIFSNSGNDTKSIIKTMEKVASLRPDITQENRVGHITLSLPPRVGKIDSKLWTELLQSAREKLALNDSFPCIAVRHSDRDHDHVHLIFSRINIAGKVHDKANIGLRCVATEALIEKRFNLEMVPEEEFKTRGHLDKDQLEKALRTGQQLPPRLQIAAALKIAVQGRPAIAQFVERLQAAGVGVKANVASTGRMNGFSFTYGGIAFSGSKIDKKYGWASLKQELDYDENEAGNIEFLSSLNGTPGRAGDDLASGLACLNGIDRALASISSTSHDTGAAVHDVAPAPDRAGELLNQNSEEGTLRAQATTDRADRADRDVELVLDRPGDHLSELAEPANLPNHKTLTTTEGDSQNGNDYADYNLYQPHPQQPARLAEAATLAGLRRLSPRGLAVHKKRPAGVLQNHALDSLADGQQRPAGAVQRSAGTSAGREVAARKIPPGFASQRPLDLSQQAWVASLPNRIGAARSTGQRILLSGLIDARNRVAAIKTNAGYSIPDIKAINDEQLAALLADAGDISQPIKITGTPDFCQRVNTLAKANRLVVTHDHQISEAERQAAQRRWEERQRDEQRQRLETPAPRPS